MAVREMPSAVSCIDYKVNVLIEVRQQRIRNQIAFTTAPSPTDPPTNPSGFGLVGFNSSGKTSSEIFQSTRLYQSRLAQD